MELIDKNELLEKIEELEAQNNCGTSDFIEAKRIAFRQVKRTLNTLEVKEVDLKRAIDKWIDDTAITHEDCSVADVISTAKYFFKLGIKAKKGE